MNAKYTLMTLGVAAALLMLSSIVPLRGNTRGPKVDPYVEFDEGQWCLDGKRYTNVVLKDVLEKTPCWRPNNEFPPVSPRRAFAAAKKMLATKLGVKDDGDSEWVPISAELRYWSRDEHRCEVWYWKVVLQENPTVGGASGLPAQADVVVLMNGIAIVPHVEPIGEDDEFCTDKDAAE